jgi:hypothetical protein
MTACFSLLAGRHSLVSDVSPITAANMRTHVDLTTAASGRVRKPVLPAEVEVEGALPTLTTTSISGSTEVGDGSADDAGPVEEDDE